MAIPPAREPSTDRAPAHAPLRCCEKIHVRPPSRSGRQRRLPGSCDPPNVASTTYLIVHFHPKKFPAAIVSFGSLALQCCRKWGHVRVFVLKEPVARKVLHLVLVE